MNTPSANNPRWIKCTVLDSPEVHLADSKVSETPTKTLCNQDVAYTTSGNAQLAFMCNACRSQMIRISLMGLKYKK